MTRGETVVPQGQYSEDQGPRELHWHIQGCQLRARGTWVLRESRTVQVEGEERVSSVTGMPQTEAGAWGSVQNARQ